MAVKPARLASHVPGDGSYLHRIQSEVWQEFMASVVALLKSASVRIARSDHGYDFQSHRGWWGTGSYKVLNERVTLPKEDSITDALVRACDAIRLNRRPKHRLKTMQVFIAQQQPRRLQNALGPLALTTDIQIASSSLHYLDLRIEAKRLLAGADVTEYCGDEGLKRFASAEPYTDRPVGMMLGYTFRHDEAHWQTRIETKAKPSGASAFELLKIGRWTVTSCVMNSPTIGRVRVIHLLLPFSSRPCARAFDAVAKQKKAGVASRAAPSKRS